MTFLFHFGDISLRVKTKCVYEKQFHKSCGYEQEGFFLLVELSFLDCYGDEKAFGAIFDM